MSLLIDVYFGKRSILSKRETPKLKIELYVRVISLAAILGVGKCYSIVVVNFWMDDTNFTNLSDTGMIRGGKFAETGMETIVLIHWKQEEAAERVTQLADLGYQAVHMIPTSQDFLRELEDQAPAGVVIDLGRAPSQGRDIAVAIRHRKSTRHLPLVFVDGDPAKVAKIRDLLPDAAYSDWEHLSGDLTGVLAHPPADPVAPESLFAGYAGKPLAQKLGIKPGMTLCLLEAPKDFRDTLGTLPTGVQLLEESGVPCHLTIGFVSSRTDLQRSMDLFVQQANSGPVWMAWPKRAAGTGTDLTQQVVRETGLAAGLVDYKICSIDEMWSGLLFARRKS
jgi:CheY-like chemotaxis protein